MKRRHLIISLALLIAALTALGTTRGGAASPCQKNADGTYHVSVGGCTFNQALQATDLGGRVNVDDGTYAPQGDSSGITRLFKSPKMVPNPTPAQYITIVGGQGAFLQGGVEIGRTNFLDGITGINLVGFKVQAGVAIRHSNYIGLIDMNIGRYLLASTHHILISGGEQDGRRVPNVVDTINNASAVTGCDSACMGTDDVTIDGTVAHDFVITDGNNSSLHSECAQYWATRTTNLLVTHSYYLNCTDFGVLVKPYFVFQATFENNAFDIPMPGEGSQPGGSTLACTPNCFRAGTSLRLAIGQNNLPPADYTGTVVRNNTMLGALTIDCNCVSKTTDLVGSSSGTGPAWQQTIDPNGRDGSLNLHLKPGAASINALPSGYARDDIDGQARPIGPAGDIGFDEFGPTDSVPPVLTVPADITVPATSSDGATVDYTASATDNADPNPVVACSPASGSLFPVGANQVGCTATDNSGNSSAAQFGVTVTDFVPPDLPPTFSGGLSAGAITSTVTISWLPATDDVLLKGYRLYRDGFFLATAGAPAIHARFSIGCGAHLFTVEAYDSKDQRTAQTINLIRNC